MDEEEIEEYPEWPASLDGCTCEHEPEEHGWGKCDVEECPCDGGWVE